MDTVRDIREQPFYWIDRHFLQEYAGRIGPLGIAVYNALVFRADRVGRAFPGLADLCNLTGIKTKNAVRRALSDLVNAGLIKINPRFDGVKYESNEYFILPIVPLENQGSSLKESGVVSLENQGSSLKESGVVSLENQGGSLKDTYLQSFNNNQNNNNHLTTSSSSSMDALPAAAASLLENYDVKIEKLNGQALDVAAWIVYALTQKRLSNPVGYALKRVKDHEKPAPVYAEIVSIEDLTWQELLKASPYEKSYRDTRLDTYLDDMWLEMETMTDTAINVLAGIAEPDHDRHR